MVRLEAGARHLWTDPFADRHGRRRPFSNWMKRLANLKSSNADVGPRDLPAKRSNLYMSSRSKKSNGGKNNPYPLSRRPAPPGDRHLSFSTPFTVSESRLSSATRSRDSEHVLHDEQNSSGWKPASRPPTLSTTGDTAISDAAVSKTGTSATAARTDGAGNSTFSSPAPSLRSMATTLTTVQSVAMPNQENTALTQNGNHPITSNSTNASSHFSHQFPSTSPAAAVPAHLAPHVHPTTYTSATANNVLTDDASILTLASSSKRRRRNSADTNASMRALAPASMFGGSRESLPLSVLSGIIDPSAGSVANAPDTLPRPSIGGIASAERASLYSSSGVAPALSTDRNSNYAGKQGVVDGASVGSGLALHGRNDSITNSIGGGPTSPLASAPPVAPTGKFRRRSSGWAEVPGDEIETEKTDNTRSEESPRPR